MRSHSKMTFHSPLGWIRAVSNGKALIRLDWNQSRWDELDRPDYVSRETIDQLKDYFSGSRTSFDLPLNPEGKSKVARRWLNIMMQIPYGTTITYQEFAAATGQPKAPRTAGTICSSNPIPIIYPCHRVVKSNGKIGNYGGGSSLPPNDPDNLSRKEALILLERLSS